MCKKAVAAFSYSWKKKRDLAAAQEKLNLPKHQLVTESPTRWGSRQKMVARMLEQRMVIAEVLASDRSIQHLVPTWHDVDVLESVHEASPLLEFTDSLFRESYVTVSYVKPVLQLLRTKLLTVNELDTQLTKDFKTKIMAYLDEKYADQATDDLLDMATLVDPRFKAQYIKPNKVEAIKTQALAEMMDDDQGLQPQAETLVETEAAGAEGGVAAEPQPPPPLCMKKQRKSLGSFFKKQSPSADALPLTERQKVQSELESYLMSPDADSESEPLEWWRLHEHNFPNMSKLVNKYLCIPPTSTPSERIFSTRGNVVTCTRAALKPDRVNQLVFLAHNLK